MHPCLKQADMSAIQPLNIWAQLFVAAAQAPSKPIAPMAAPRRPFTVRVPAYALPAVTGSLASKE